MGAPMSLMNERAALRAAAPDDADLLARVADMAGEGLPSHLWAAAAGPGETAFEVGRRRARRDAGAFCWRNATVATWRGAPVGAVIDYDADDAAPVDADVPPLLRPLCELERRAAGTRYVNILAVLPQARRRGVAETLMDGVAARTRRDLTLIVASGNRGARAFYAAQGFDEDGALPMGPGGPEGLAGEWILLRRAAR